ncbi:MAG: glutathione S-transferase family protein [Pseudomonadota bacterium]
MPQPVLRIFSYLPNPRVWKALIAAEICGVEVETLGDKPAKLATWLWDYAARPLDETERTPQNPHLRVGSRGFSGALYKTDAFLKAHPFGTVPAAFGPEGGTGIFESNSILRAAVRAAEDDHGLYGTDAYAASRIDSFLDANLVFAREAQVYLLAMDNLDVATHRRMQGAYEFFLGGIERALASDPFICGATMTLADISFVCDTAQFLREGHYAEQLAAADLPLISKQGLEEYPKAFAHMLNLSSQPVFAKHMGSYLDWFRRAHNLEITHG